MTATSPRGDGQLDALEHIEVPVPLMDATCFHHRSAHANPPPCDLGDDHRARTLKLIADLERRIARVARCRGVAAVVRA